MKSMSEKPDRDGDIKFISGNSYEISHVKIYENNPSVQFIGDVDYWKWSEIGGKDGWDYLTPEPVTVDWVKPSNNMGCHAKIGAFELMVFQYEGGVCEWDVRCNGKIIAAIESGITTDRPTAQVAAIAAYNDLRASMPEVRM